MCGAQIFSGRAGNPAPEPMSRTRGVQWSVISGWWSVPSTEYPVEPRTPAPKWALDGAPSGVWRDAESWASAGKRWRARNKDSPKWRGSVFFWWGGGGGVGGGVPRGDNIVYG